MNMRFLVLLFPAVLLGGETIKAFNQSWTVQKASDWSIEASVLRLMVPGEPPAGQPRRPQKYALADLPEFGKVTLEAEVRRGGRSVVLIYAWQDSSHFNYAHLSSDTGAQINVHNGMFHIFGGERVRMSVLDGPPSLGTTDWIPVKLVFDGDSGRCYVEVNGMKNPSLEAMDMSLRWGKVGFGSFDETGDFRNVRIKGTLAQVNKPGFR